MATNCPQLLKPRACRSALCLRTAASKPIREMTCNICEKMLHTLLKAESSSDFVAFGKTQLIRELSLVSYAEGLSSAELIWTNVRLLI
jgi:hypothetical protein